MSSRKLKRETSSRRDGPPIKLPTPEKSSRDHERGVPQQCDKENVLSRRLNSMTVNSPMKSIQQDSESDGKLDIFCDETTQVSRLAVENYFLQGKCVTELNKTNVRRRKTKNIPSSNNDEQEVDQLTAGSSFLKCELQDVRDYMKDRDSSKRSEDFRYTYHAEFSYWMLLLASDCNILLHGVGSKRRILDDFVTLKLSNLTYMRIDAMRNDIRSMLVAINDHLKLQCPATRGTTLLEWARMLVSRIEKNNRQIILVVDNIESDHWRNEKGVLCELLKKCRHVKIIASVDHVNSTIGWNSRHLVSLHFVHVRCDNFNHPLQELISGVSKILGLDPKSSKAAHSMASLDVFWKSMAQNSRKIFWLFFKLFFADMKSVIYWDFFNACRDNYLVLLDATLRAQLVEFNDHGIIKWSRGDDGNETLSGIVQPSLVMEFLATKGMSLENDDFSI